MLGLGIQLPWRQQTLGIPRSGLVCWHDLYDPTASLASVPDLSGNGYSLQRGSTAGEDSNDPAWGTNGKGLVFTTDDYCLTGNLSGVSMAGPFTLIMVANFTAASGRYWSLENGAATDQGFRFCPSDGRFQTQMQNVSYTYGHAALPIPDAVVAMAVVKSGSGADRPKVLRMDTGATAAGPIGNMPTGVPRIGIGCQASSTVDRLVDNMTAHSHIFYNRALSNAEIQRIYRSLKATWAARGVEIL